MAATCVFVEEGAIVTATTVATNLNFGNTISANLNSSTYPVTVGNYSKSKIFQLRFDGTYTAISNIKLYKSAGSYVTGQCVNFGTSTTFITPTGGSSPDSIAITLIPASIPSTPNVLVGGTSSYSITTSATLTDYIYLQASISILASATVTPTLTLCATWDETP